MSLLEFLDTDYRIHPFLKLFGTVTGRLSAEDPSVLNIVKNKVIKSGYLPETGHYWGVADHKQMELRIYALLSGDKFLEKVFQDPTIDPHQMISDELERRSGKRFERDVVKSGVFGRLYGRGLESYIYRFGLSRESAREFVKIIDALFPGIDKYKRSIQETIHKQGYLENYFGRRRRFPLITPELRHEIYRMGVNFPVQSTASDVNLSCMLHIYENRERLGATPMFPVHDSIVMDLVDKECAILVKKEIEEFSDNLVDHKMVFRVEMEVGKNWGEVEKV
jgi:DNA polymerase-1